MRQKTDESCLWRNGKSRALSALCSFSIRKYQEKNIIGKEIEIPPNELEEYDLDSLESMLIRVKGENEFSVSKDYKEKLRTDESGNRIKGITVRGKYILVSNRVYDPKEDDDFEAQDPMEMYEKIINIIDKEIIEELRLRFFISMEQLKELNPFHWSMEFSDFFNSKDFDIVIGNPPYGNILSDIEKDSSVRSFSL